MKYLPEIKRTLAMLLAMVLTLSPLSVCAEGTGAESAETVIAAEAWNDWNHQENAEPVVQVIMSGDTYTGVKLSGVDQNGKEVWGFETEKYSSPATFPRFTWSTHHGDRFYYNDGETMNAISVATGEKIWEVKTENWPLIGYIGDDGRIYAIGTFGSSFTVIDENGKILHHRDEMGNGNCFWVIGVSEIDNRLAVIFDRNEDEALLGQFLTWDEYCNTDFMYLIDFQTYDEEYIGMIGAGSTLKILDDNATRAFGYEKYDEE